MEALEVGSAVSVDVADVGVVGQVEVALPLLRSEAHPVVVTVLLGRRDTDLT